MKYRQIPPLIILFLLLSTITAISSPYSYDFDYSVNGQKVIFSPTINNNYDFYQWTMNGNDETFIETDWIDVDDIHNHESILSFDVTYHVQLHVKDTNNNIYELGKYVSLSSAHGAGAEVDDEDIETIESIEGFDNMFNSVPNEVSDFFGYEMNPIIFVLIILAISCIIYLHEKKYF